MKRGAADAQERAQKSHIGKLRGLPKRSDESNGKEEQNWSSPLAEKEGRRFHAGVYVIFLILEGITRVIV